MTVVVPRVLQHFLRTESASLHRSTAALYGLVSSEPLIKPISFETFSRSVNPKILGLVETFASERSFVFSGKDSIGYDVMYTDMSNNVATFYFLTTTSGKTIFVNSHGEIELVD